MLTYLDLRSFKPNNLWNHILQNNVIIESENISKISLEKVLNENKSINSLSSQLKLIYIILKTCPYHVWINITYRYYLNEKIKWLENNLNYDSWFFVNWYHVGYKNINSSKTTPESYFICIFGFLDKKEAMKFKLMV